MSWTVPESVALLAELGVGAGVLAHLPGHHLAVGGGADAAIADRDVGALLAVDGLVAHLLVVAERLADLGGLALGVVEGVAVLQESKMTIKSFTLAPLVGALEF